MQKRSTSRAVGSAQFGAPTTTAVALGDCRPTHWVAMVVVALVAALLSALVVPRPAAADARPVAANDTLAVGANVAFTLDFCANDLPGDGASTIIYVTAAPAGVTRTGCVLSGATDRCNDNLIWYFVRDADGDTDWGRITLSVDCSNIDRVPRPKPDILRNFFKDQPSSFDLCANDDLGDQPTVVSYSTALPPGLTRQGCNITGVPTTCASAANFFYWLQDGDGDRGYTYATIQVRCTPVPQPDSYTMQEGVFFSANLCENDYLADEPTSTAYSILIPAGLAVANCVLSGTPTECGVFEANYWIRDRDGDRNGTTISITIECAVRPLSSIVYFDDMETSMGWTVDPDGTDSAAAGIWERANPGRTTGSGTTAGVVYQLGSTPSGLSALVTGSAEGADPAANDVDGGTTTVRSQPIDVPYGIAPIIEFDWYLAHSSSASGADSLVVTATGPAGAATILSVEAEPKESKAQWRHHAVAIPQFAGQQIQVTVSATDDLVDSVIEAAIDNVEIRQIPIAPDAAAVSGAITTAEYRLPAAIDSAVRSDMETELWARLYRPANLTAGPYPLVMIMHGNHFTCGTGGFPREDNNNDYATTGSCPSGYTPIVSHEGYAWLAEPLARAGYLVVSINTNRGINGLAGIPDDDGLVLTRGRLLLRHLETLSQWATAGGAPPSLGVGANGLIGAVDFGQVALVGHSRGGEGSRAVPQLYNAAGSPWPALIPGLNIGAIAEIGASDGHSSQQLDVAGIPWLAVLPMCDLDEVQWKGYEVLARSILNTGEAPPAPKAAFAIWGADHNGFNSEWELHDDQAFPGGCTGEQNWAINDATAATAIQVGPARAGVMALIRGFIGPNADPIYTRALDPLFSLAPTVTQDDAMVERTWVGTPGTGLILDNFTNPTGVNSNGAANESAGVTLNHVKAPAYLGAGSAQQGADIRWTNPGASTYFQSNWMVAGTGRDVSTLGVFEFRIGRASTAGFEANPNFSIRLVQADGTLTAPVQLNRYATVWDMPGAQLSGAHYDRPGMQSVRIPIGDFGTVDTTSIRGARFTFDDGAGDVLIADMRFATG